jgi:hypothetical protein
MPYIKRQDREKFDSHINELVKLLSENKIVSPGELNYLISSIIWKIYDRFPSYTLANNMIGALECVKQEFYRRKLSSYEDVKIGENGDI